MTRTISQAELRNGSAAVMDALEAGEDFVITRNGVVVGELRPARRVADLSADALVRRFAHLSSDDSLAQMRGEADALFGEDRI